MAEIKNRLPDNNENQPEKKAPKKKNDKPGVPKRIAKWFRELKSELKKVTWPTVNQTTNNTIVALVVMAISAVCAWGFDSIAGLVVRTLITLVG